MRAEIISVGTELLLGDIVNTNARFLSQELAALGYTVYYQTVVGDNALRLRSLIAEAKERSDVLIFSGGLGPTEDDLTKETVAEAFGDFLAMDREELAKIENFFKARGRTMSENNRKQAMVPHNGKSLPNENGTAPGAFFRQGSKYAFLLPGPPSELEPMFLNQVRPMLEAMQDAAIRSLTLRTMGIGESDLEGKVAPLLEGENPTAALYAKTGEVHIRITAKAGTSEQADVMCAEYAKRFKELLGDVVYSENGDDLETTLVGALTAKNETIATAESCTGGLLSERITSVPGASAVFGFGAITYANDVKHQLLGVKNGTLRRHGAVSSQVASEMAYGAASHGNADYGIGITGVAGPDGGSEEKPVGLVYVAASKGRQVHIRKLQIANRPRDTVRKLATQNALDMARRLVLGLPMPEAKQFDKSQQADYERVGKPRRKAGPLGRVLVAVLLVIVLFGLLIGGTYLARLGNTQTDSLPLPSAAGLRYGTLEYTAAAQKLVSETAAENPTVVGFIALPTPRVENLVMQENQGQEVLVNAASRTGGDDMAAISSSAPVAQATSNTVIVGDTAFEPLLAWLDTSHAGELSTFTYYTAKDAKVYEVLAVYLLDEDETQADGFDPAVQSLVRYEEHLTFVLGTKMRSVYDVPADVDPADSFLSLAVARPGANGQRLFVCGRLLRAGESVEALPMAGTAGMPLMPSGYYKQNALAAPSMAQLYDQWLCWYMTRHLSNAQLQYGAGMPAADARPQEQTPQADASSAETSDSIATNSDNSFDASSASPSVTSSSASAASGGSSSVASMSAVQAAIATKILFGQSPTSSASSQSTASSSGDASSSDEDSNTGASVPQPQQTPADALTVTMNGVVITDKAANILAKICQREAPAASPAVIKALAIAVQSWILSQQYAGNPAPAVLGLLPSPTVQQAVNEVVDMALSKDGETPAFTPFFAIAATGTNTAEVIWGYSRTYLQTASSPHDQGLANWREIYSLSADEAQQMLAATIGFANEEGLSPEKWFTDVEKNEGGYVMSLKVGGIEISGVDFWQHALLKSNVPLLRSPAFDIEYDGKNFVFTCYGAGHGCGMSLAGAEGFAREGWDYARILAHYYPGAQIVELE